MFTSRAGRLAATMRKLAENPRHALAVPNQARKDAILAQYGQKFDAQIIIPAACQTPPQAPVNWVIDQFMSDASVTNTKKKVTHLSLIHI